MLVGHPGSAANLSEEPVEVFHGHQPILAVFNPEKSGAICCTKISQQMWVQCYLNAIFVYIIDIYIGSLIFNY